MAEIAQTCLQAAEADMMTFPEIVRILSAEGFESYMVDFRRNAATYYTADGDSIVVPMEDDPTPIAPALDTMAVQAAIKEAQQLVPGYRYLGFCSKVRAAGCAGYLVSFSGRRAVYYGRTAELHLEHFPR